MIQKLRRKFILVAMCSTFVVLLVIMGIVDIVNYRRILERSDVITEVLGENGGRFNNFMEPPKPEGDNQQPGEQPQPKGMTAETPYSTRFFSVTYDRSKNVTAVDIGKIAAVDRKEAIEYAKNVLENSKKTGFSGIYRFRKVENLDNTMIIFLDCSQDLESFQSMALSMVAVSFVGLCAVFILVLIFSKIVFQSVEENYEKQKRFITDASHELKTPLTIIEANTEVVEMECGESQWTKSTKHQVKRLTSMTNQLITLSKLDEEDSLGTKEEFSLSKVLNESVELFEGTAKAKNKRLTADIEDNIQFYGNKKSIEQLMEILLDNAIKYSSPEGSINVSLKRTGRKIGICVTNDTEEVKQGNQDILFERFYRADSSRNSQTGGTGIGLSVAKAVVLNHKGKISAFSRDGKSLEIKIEFR